MHILNLSIIARARPTVTINRFDTIEQSSSRGDAANRFRLYKVVSDDDEDEAMKIASSAAESKHTNP